MLGHVVPGAMVGIEASESLVIYERTAELMVDTAYDEWCRAAATCQSEWKRWAEAAAHARRGAYLAYQCALDREEAAARVLSQACAVAEERWSCA